jgi:hypothetical protein
VRLLVSEAEQELRLVDPSRREFQKLVDVQVLRRIRADRSTPVELPPIDLEIDTGTSSAVDSARAIVSHFGLTPEVPTDPYR